MALRFCNNLKNIIDDRREADKIFHVQEFSVTYTLETDDITKGEKPDCTPYASRMDALSLNGKNSFVGEMTRSKLQVEEYQDGLKFLLQSDNTELSEFGLNLPFNFMGKVNGGGWQNQFLFNSPYISDDRTIFYFYLTKPNGAHLVVAVKGCVGWKMDYSPYVGGHYFLNLKLFANFDRAFQQSKGDNTLEFIILPVDNFHEAFEKLSAYYSVPFLDIDKNGGKIGKKICLKAFGEIDEILIDGRERLPFTGEYILEKIGETKITPFYQGKKGADVTLYSYETLVALYKKAMNTVDLDVVKNFTDGNLCEHQSWCLPMLRFLIKYKDVLTENEVKTYESKILSLMSVITEKNPEKALHRRTMLPYEFEGIPAYCTFRSRRVQEQFFGIGILLDAYKYFKNEEYLSYAIHATDALIKNYQYADGGLKTLTNLGMEDYTTVCAPMIPIVDMAKFLQAEGNPRAEYYFQAAEKMAEFLYGRGLNFPTEGGERSELAEPEMEDGSISCTALNLLYYRAKVRREDRYIRKAKEILDVHESWVIKTPRCQMHGSSLRWWETRWEGDADGPALCCGHAWTIWRAEADYWYAYLSGEEDYYKKAFNGFMTNLSKIDADGNSYAIYNVDDINGGGFKKRSEDICFKIAPKYASVPDCGLSRYVWGRLCETFLQEK